jgi:hypothetical protein
LDRDTKLRHDVVAALQGIVGMRLTGVRLLGSHFASQELATAALMARPFHRCSGVELLLDGAPSIAITGEADHEHEGWQDAEGWESGYAIVATKRKPSGSTTDGARAIDASDLPPWRSHVGRTIDRIQVLGERGRGPVLVKLEFLDGAVCIGCGAGTESGDSFDFRFGDGDEVLAASERQVLALVERPAGTVLWAAEAAPRA